MSEGYVAAGRGRARGRTTVPLPVTTPGSSSSSSLESTRVGVGVSGGGPLVLEAVGGEGRMTTTTAASPPPPPSVVESIAPSTSSSMEARPGSSVRGSSDVTSLVSGMSALRGLGGATSSAFTEVGSRMGEASAESLVEPLVAGCPGSSVTSTVESTTPSTSTQQARTTPYVRKGGDDDGVVRTITPGFDKHGTMGAPLPVQMNYYSMSQKSDHKLYQYRVDFNPVEDNTHKKKWLLAQHEGKLGKYVFDGSIVCIAKFIPSEIQELESMDEAGTTRHVIQLRLVGQVNPDDAMYLQFYNVLMRKAMNSIGLEEIGRNMYDRSLAIKFDQDFIELWPGFATAIRNHDSGTLLCAEVTHKVLQNTNCLLGMRQLQKTARRPEDFEKLVRAEFQDTIIMTHYNRKTYKITEIDFSICPKSEFRGQDGVMHTYVEYYKNRYGITIPEADLTQPMLVSQPKKRDINKGVTGDIYLVPSLCHPTGLSDAHRKNFSLMKRLSVHLHMDPKTRGKKLHDFITKLKTEAKPREEFAAWNIDFNPEPLITNARRLPKQQIIMGPNLDNPINADDKGDWTRGMRGRTMMEAKPLKRWILLHTKDDAEACRGFVTTLKKMGQEIGITVCDPLKMVQYEPNRYDELLIDKSIREYDTDKEPLDLLFVILPNNSLRRYAEFKHYAASTRGIPCQCYLSKNLRHANLNSVASKVMIQITAKMGGIPWGVKVPTKRAMILGYDVYHCASRKGESAGALVATMNAQMTRYHSLVNFHKDKVELATNIYKDFTVMLREYLKTNGFLPDRIMMFRDGVGEGQIKYVLDHEVVQMKTAIADVCEFHGVDKSTIKLSFIIVTKKINTRAFMTNGLNVPVGTVIDSAVTLPERYDFFMVSQDVRQGTVSPTNYNVVFDESQFNADKMQLMALKLTHMYYNWSGTVAVPAPCQYAHKLAYLTGVAIGEKASEILNDRLWYL